MTLLFIMLFVVVYLFIGYLTSLVVHTKHDIYLDEDGFVPLILAAIFWPVVWLFSFVLWVWKTFLVKPHEWLLKTLRVYFAKKREF